MLQGISKKIADLFDLFKVRLGQALIYDSVDCFLDYVFQLETNFGKKNKLYSMHQDCFDFSIKRRESVVLTEKRNRVCQGSNLESSAP